MGAKNEDIHLVAVEKTRIVLSSLDAQTIFNSEFKRATAGDFL